MADKGGGKLTGGQQYPKTELDGKGSAGSAGKYGPDTRGKPSQTPKGSMKN